VPMPKININREQLTQFVFNNKKNLIIGGVILLVGFIILVVLFRLNYNFINKNRDEQIQQQTGSETAKSPDSGTVSTYLPDTGRKLEDSSEIRDPFSSGMVLKGIITGGSGGNLAIIESGNTAFVAGPGEEIAGGWTVTEIKRSAVIIKMGIHKLQLDFNGRVKDLTPRAVQAKPAANKSSEKTAAVGQNKTGADDSANDTTAMDKTASGDTEEQSSTEASGETSGQGSEQISEQTSEPTAKMDNQSSDTTGEEGVDE